VYLTRLAENNPRAFNRLAVVFFGLFLLSVADLLVHTLSESNRTFKVLAGGEARVSGKLQQPIDARLLQASAAPSDRKNKPDVDYDRLLTYTTEGHDFGLRITDVQGRLWRGVLWADARALPGQASLQVFARPGPAPDDGPLYTVHIFADRAGIRKSYRSLTKRFLGIEPLWVPLMLFPFAWLFFTATYKATRREEGRMQVQGIGPIYKLAKRKDHWEVVFGLGALHGIQTGRTLQLLDTERQKVAEFIVDTVAEDYSTAKLDLSTPIRSDYLVDGSQTRTG
jgi:hypothetical protein